MKQRKLPWVVFPKQSKRIQGLAEVSEVRMLRLLTFSCGGVVYWSATIADWLTESQGCFWLAGYQKRGSFIDWLTLRSLDSGLKPVNGTGFKVSWHLFLTTVEEQSVMTYKKRNFILKSKGQIAEYICTHTHIPVIHEINPLTKFQVYNAVLLTISMVSFSKFLGL